MPQYLLILGETDFLSSSGVPKMGHTKDFISERRRTDMLHRIEGNLLNHAVGSQIPPSYKQRAAGMISKRGYCAAHNVVF